MFNIKLKRMRKKLGITQAQLAKKLGVSPSAVGMYEQGRREPDVTMLTKIANLFDVSVDFFLESKQAKIRAKNAEEIANKIKTILQGNKGLRKDLDKKTLDSITDAVWQGLKQALDDDEDKE